MTSNSGPNTPSTPKASEPLPQLERTNSLKGIAQESSQALARRPILAVILAILIFSYVVIVSSYYNAHLKLSKKLQHVQDQHMKLLKTYKSGLTNSCSLPDGVEDLVDEGVGFPFIAFGIVAGGSFLLIRFLFLEYQVYLRKSSQGNMSFTWTELVQYRLDHFFSSNQMAKPMLLLSVTFSLILVSSVGFYVTGVDDISKAMWRSWTYVADPGTHADAEGTLERTVAFWTTIGGMLVFALMIGIISDSIGEKVDELKKGKSRVIESNHTLMLGWNDKSLAIIQQLALANESEGGGSVVVLSEKDKEELEDFLRAAEDSRDSGLELRGTEVIFRTGNPLVEHELMKVSVATARAIICLSPDGLDPDEADSRMVRQVLSLKGLEQLTGHVVVEMQDIDNRDLVEMVGEPDVEVVVAHDIIGRLMIQCARSPGLAHVLENLMGFEGSEFYLKEWPEVENLKFGDITCRFDDAVPIGIKNSEKNCILLNPDSDLLIGPGDEILCLAEDDDSYAVNDGSYNAPLPPLPPVKEKKRPAEKMLFCGWRRDLADMIMVLENSVPPGSELWLFNTVKVEKRAEMLLDKGNKSELTLKNLEILNAEGNPIVRRDLQKIIDYQKSKTLNREKRVTLDQFDSVLILADAAIESHGSTDMQSSDSRSLASLLIIRDIQQKIQIEKGANGEIITLCNPISEILDTRTRSLLKTVKCSGYVMSNEIVSAAIAQIAECRDLNTVMDELLSAKGNEPRVVDITDYIDFSKKKPKQYSFWDICRLARLRKQVALGYKPHDVDWSGSSETLLNPPDKAQPRTWHEEDIVIIIGRTDNQV